MTEQPEERRVNERKRVETGDFRIGEGVFTGVIVRNGPEVRGADGGNRAEATILVGPWDGRQRAEREPPLFVRVKAFARAKGNAFEQLEGCEKGDRISVAGSLVLHVWRDKEEQLRQGMEVLADHVLREQRFPALLDALAPDAAEREGTGPVKEEDFEIKDSDDSDVPF